MPALIGEIDHIELEASDAEEMAEFRETLGFEEVRRTDHHGLSIELATPDGRPALDLPRQVLLRLRSRQRPSATTPSSSALGEG